MTVVFLFSSLPNASGVLVCELAMNYTRSGGCAPIHCFDLVISLLITIMGRESFFRYNGVGWSLTCHRILGNSIRHVGICKEKQCVQGLWWCWPTRTVIPGAHLSHPVKCPHCLGPRVKEKSRQGHLCFSFPHCGNPKLKNCRPSVESTGIDQPSQCQVDKRAV